MYHRVIRHSDASKHMYHRDIRHSDVSRHMCHRDTRYSDCSTLPGNRATAQGEGEKIDLENCLEAIAHRCGQKSKYDSHLYRNQSNLTTTKTL